MFKRFIGVAFIFSVFNYCNGQSLASFSSIKNFVPPSPEAQAMNRYGEIPVDLSAGIPSISVPIYEIRSRKLSLPISLSYHASGIRVSDVATPVGLGWVLNADGQVSRSVVGKADIADNFTPSNFKNRSYYQGKIYDFTTGSADLYTLSSLSNGTFDSQSDIYNFNVPSLAGRFVYDSSFAIHYTPVDRQIKILRPGGMFTIVDDLGVTYEFTVTDTTITQPASDITSWHLTRMVSADKTDTISFEYFSAAIYYDTTRSNSFFARAPRSTAPGSGCELLSVEYQNNYTENWTIQKRKLLKKIVFANGYAEFVYAADRQDGIAERLTGIKIFDLSGNLVREAVLHQSYFGTGDAKRLKLDMVSIQGSNSTTQMPYRFQYNESVPLPSRKSKETDFWGYYNGNGATSLLPASFETYLTQFFNEAGYSAGVNQPIINAYLQGAGDRYVNAAYTQAGMLKRITYPTGGSTTFEFENNKGYSIHGDYRDYVGGLRIRKVIFTDSVAMKNVIRSYKYDSAAPITRSVPDDYYFNKKTVYSVSPSAGAVCYSLDLNINANPINAISYYNGSPVIYHKVSEFLGDSISNIGRTDYYYEYDSDSAYNSPDMRKYWNFSTDKSWARGSLLAKKEYKFENSSYTLVRELRNHYEKKGTKLVKVGQLCEQMTDVVGMTLESYLVNVYSQLPNYPYLDRFLLTHFDYLDVVLSIGVKSLVSSEEINYSNGALTKRQDIFYESPDHLYPTRKLTFTSATNDTLKEVTKYPQDKTAISNLSSTAAAAIDSMVNRHIRMIPIETEIYRNAKLLTRNRTEFRNWNLSGKLYEEFLSNQVKQAPMEQRIQYKGYDERGNVEMLSYVNGYDISYLWGYNKTLSVAQAVNAKSNEIFFDSFEEGNGWEGTVVSYDRNKVHTGRVSGRIDKQSAGELYVFSNKWISIPDAGLRKFKFSGWVYSTGPSAELFVMMKRPGETGYPSYYDVVGTNVLNKWVYIEKEFTVPSDAVLFTMRIDNNGGGTVWFDDIRLHPATAQMTSYTYDPLIGVTSVSDVNSRPTYYEYDSHNRLSLVRDQYSHIVKKVCYNYSGQTEACPFDATPQWIATGELRCQPCPANSEYYSNVQEHREMDNNPNSTSYNTYRWVSDGVTSGCNPPPNWQNTVTALRCKLVSGSNTGEREQEQQDMNPCSPTGGQTRWVVVDQNCSSCPKSAVWQLTGNYRCVINGGNNTGEQEREERDNESCSATYNQTRWVSVGVNCSTCPKPSNWQTTGNYRCATSTGINTGYQEREERDNESCSSTYNQTRWVNNGLNCSTCPKPTNWQSTGSYRCVTDASGNYTGYQERQERDNESCSATYNQTRWVSNGYNPGACVPCTSNCSGQGYKCINNNCELGIKVYTGSYQNFGICERYYHYEWSDGSWSITYTEFQSGDCPTDN